jgi:type VI secretion system secreted protein Hcp
MAVDIFLKLGDIKGESVDSVHKGEIDVLGWSWGLSQSGTTHEGPGGGSGKVSVQDISFTKYVDSASHALILAACKGTHFKEATLVVRKAGGGSTALEYIKIKLTEVIVTSVSTGGSGGEDRLTENVSLNFGEFSYQYTDQKGDGSKGTTKTAAWDIAANAEAK